MKPEHKKLAMNSLLLLRTPPDLVETVLASARVLELDRGATIFLQVEQANAIYIVAEGWVKIFRIAANGAEAVVHVVTKSQSFGEAASLRNDNYPVTAEAVTDTALIRIDAEVLRRLICECPEFAMSILAATFQHLHELVAQVEQLKAQTGAQRVAEFLLDLAPCESGTCTVTLPYDKVLIAGRLGLKPESLSRAFHKLRDKGVRINQNHALIDNVMSLRDYAEEDPARAWASST